jgi:hypothetical protein
MKREMLEFFAETEAENAGISSRLKVAITMVAVSNDVAGRGPGLVPAVKRLRGAFPERLFVFDRKAS